MQPKSRSNLFIAPFKETHHQALYKATNNKQRLQFSRKQRRPSLLGPVNSNLNLSPPQSLPLVRVPSICIRSHGPMPAWRHRDLAGQDARPNSCQSQVTVRLICGEPYVLWLPEDLAGQCVFSLPPDKAHRPHTGPARYVTSRI